MSVIVILLCAVISVLPTLDVGKKETFVVSTATVAIIWMLFSSDPATSLAAVTLAAVALMNRSRTP